MILMSPWFDCRWKVSHELPADISQCHNTRQRFVAQKRHFDESFVAILNFLMFCCEFFESEEEFYEIKGLPEKHQSIMFELVSLISLIFPTFLSNKTHFYYGNFPLSDFEVFSPQRQFSCPNSMQAPKGIHVDGWNHGIDWHAEGNWEIIEFISTDWHLRKNLKVFFFSRIFFLIFSSFFFQYD